MDGIE